VQEPEPRVTPADLPAIEDYRQVYEAVALPVLIIDHASWLILAVNEAAVQQYGYEREEFVGLPVLEVRPPEGQEEARRVMSELPHGFWKTTSAQHRRKDGSVFSVDVWSRDTVVDGRAVRIATIHEVTERLQIQEELQQAQKMEVVGRLARGIAHDFNNALTAIIGASHLLMGQLEGDPDARTDLEDILRAAHRSARLTRHLLAFSRQQVLRVETCGLAEVVERSVGLLEPILEGHVEFRTRIDPGSWPVKVDRVQLEQVIMNLVVNAQDAMPDGGTLVLATGNLQVSPQDASADPAVPAGDYGVLTVSDTGTGMDEITRARIFEPFFTTKPPPEGTGLGLSMVYGIIRQCEGFITVESELDAGTTFRILLPRAVPTPGEARPLHIAAPPGGSSALVVDADDGIRRSTGRILESMGYTVVQADSAEAALAALEGSERNPDLLVTELTLPGMGGRALADRLQASAPAMGALLLAGYGQEGGDDLRSVERGRGILRKPISVESLTGAVRRVRGES
jgi:two-component system, cell cycle sensor histidine kinase and response regulator CckA